YDNQRPYVASVPGGDSLVLTWERRFQTGSQQVYLLGLNRDGLPDGLLEEVTGRFDLARSPRIIFEDDRPVLVWFTNPQGNSRTVIGRRGVFRWETENLSPAVGEATFAEGVVFNDRLHLIWQRRSGEAGSDIVYVEPDQSVREPEILAANFRAGERSGNAVARFVVRDPPDASGIRAYAWTWSRDPDSPVPRRIVQRVPERTVVVRAEEDGPWYLRVRSTDFAGNWSEPATIRFELDTTPPPPVSFPPPSVDENGFLASNTFQVGWNPPVGEEGLIAGYSVRLDFLGEEIGAAIDALPSFAVPPRVTTTAESIGRTNVDNGLWVLTVAAVDSVGNIGAARSLPLRLDKYVPVTRVFAVPIVRDLLGRYRMTVLGRGFDSNGTIRQVVLDRDGAPPYDHEFNDWQNQFSVETDGEVSGLLIDDIETGVYRIGLLHSERGMYIAPTPITIRARGVIVYGDFRSTFAPRYGLVDRVRTVDTRDIAFYLTVAAAVALILISAVRLVHIGGEIQRLNIEARALVLGADPETLRAGAERTRRMRVQGISLRIKFTFFVVLLVIGVVVLVAVVLGRNVLRRQERILVSGLQERIELLVDGQVTGARPALQNPELNLDQLQTLASQGEAMAEAAYVTITGLNGRGELQTIYGTIDPAVVGGAEGRITTDVYTVGVSRLTDEVTPVVDRLAEEINAQAISDLGEIPIEIERLSQEAQALILRGASEEEIARIDQVRVELLRRGRLRLDEIAGPIRSVPEFDFTRLRRDVTSYLFFSPVLDIVPGADAGFEDYYRGTVRVAISTQLILDEIDSTRRDLVLATMIIAALAVAAGVFGAYI
ncbi:MAG: hypothetical protein MI724_18295, partial [Spirochaetales bacterium]|nr:hypothetical protein [Spirochaetales bacterium]